MAEVNKHEAERDLDLVWAEFRNYQQGIMPAGPGACELTEFFAHVDGKLTTGEATASKTQRNDREVLNLLTKRARTLHLGAADYCWFTDPAEHAEQTKTFLGSLGPSRKTERARPQADLDRALRVLDSIDTAADPKNETDNADHRDSTRCQREPDPHRPAQDPDHRDEGPPYPISKHHRRTHRLQGPSFGPSRCTAR